MTLDKKITLCENLTPVEVRIGNYIMNHKETILNCTIQDLEKEVFVSKSAIHRFCKKIGLNGFNDLKIELAKEEKMEEENWVDANVPFYEKDHAKEIANKLMDLYKSTIQDTYKCLDAKRIDEIAKIVNSAIYVDIYAVGHNENIAQNFKQKMLNIGKIVNCPSAYYEQSLITLASNSDHVAIVLSYSGAMWSNQLRSQFLKKNVPVILITRAGVKEESVDNVYHLFISDSENLQNRISQFSSRIAMQYIMDVLYGAIYNLNRTKNNQYIRKSMSYHGLNQ